MMNALFGVLLGIGAVIFVFLIPCILESTYDFISFYFPAGIFNSNGNQAWFKDGELHRDNDLPAVIHINGTQKWYQNGKLHRNNDLPAIIYADGQEVWFQNGKLHRDNDLPAVVDSKGSRMRYICCRNNGLSNELWEQWL